MREPKSDFIRYAYGFSNRKPHWSFWVMIGVMVVADIAFLVC